MKLALRWLFKRPAFAAAAISSLALGIGANAAVFSLIDAVLFRPFPVRSQNELVLLRSQRGVEVPTKVSLPDYRDFREGQEVCTDILAHARFDFSIRAGERTERVAGELVSWNYLDVLGVPVSYGRSLTPAEEDIASPVVIISDRLWRRSFGEDLDTVGKMLLVNGHSLTVVGLLLRVFPDFMSAPKWIFGCRCRCSRRSGPA